MTDLNPGIAEL